MRRSNSIRSNNKALRLDVSQRTDKKDFAEDVAKPATHLTVFSPLEAIHIHGTRVISGIFSACFQLGETGYKLLHFAFYLKIQTVFVCCNEPLVLGTRGEKRGEKGNMLRVNVIPES